MFSFKHYSGAILIALGLVTSEYAMAELHNTTSNLFSGYLQNRHMVRSALTPYWQEPWGDWTIVGIARPDNDDGTLFVTEEGEGILINGSTGKTSNLIAIPDTGDCNLTLEFMVPKGSNSGVYLMGRYEVQIFDSWGVKNPNFSDCGGIYQRDSKSDHDRFEGRAPDNNMSKKPGDWQKFEIEFRAPRFDDEGNKTENARFIEVVHNGQVIHENVEVAGPTRSAAFQDEQPMGPLMLQGDHGPVAFRNVSLWWKTDHPIGVDGHPRKSNSE